MEKLIIYAIGGIIYAAYSYYKKQAVIKNQSSYDQEDETSQVIPKEESVEDFLNKLRKEIIDEPVVEFNEQPIDHYEAKTEEPIDNPYNSIEFQERLEKIKPVEKTYDELFPRYQPKKKKTKVDLRKAIISNVILNRPQY